MEFAVIICHSMWTIIFGRLGNLWICCGWIWHVPVESILWTLSVLPLHAKPCTAHLPLWGFLRRGRNSPDPCQNDKACVRLDRLMRLLSVWEIRKSDNRYCLFLIPYKIPTFDHRFIIQYHP